jgi:tetratricopeptide (TPR) repeat protein
VAAACLAVVSSSEKGVTDEQRDRVGSWLEEALRRQPGSTRIRLALASVRSMQRRYDQIESIYRDVLSASPDNLEALNNLAWLLAHRAGKEREALGLIDRAIAIGGSNPTLFDTRAVIRLQLGETEPAIRDLRAAMVINPEKSVLYFHLAQALERAGNPRKPARPSARRSNEA